MSSFAVTVQRVVKVEPHPNADRLEIYEPPAPPQRMQTAGNAATRKDLNPNFREYTDIENIKNHPGVLQDGEFVWVMEKIHGTNFRAGWVPYHANTAWKQLLRFFRIAPKWEFVYGSRTVQLQYKTKSHKTWLETHGKTEKNVYREMVDQYDLPNKIPKGQVWYGEIYGEGIQKGYSYSLTGRKVAWFDVMKDGEWMDWGDIGWHENNIFDESTGEAVPVYGIMPYNEDEIKSLAWGPSWLDSHIVKGGVVVRPTKERTSHMGRVILKVISPDYLLRDQTEFH